MAKFAAIPILRGLQLAMALTSLGLSAKVVNYFMRGSRTASPTPFMFITFTSVFSLLSLLYLVVVPRFAPRASHPYASIAVDMTNTIFYFAGFIVLAVYMTGLTFCRGAVCSASRAVAVFAAAQFTVWIASTILTVKDLFVKSSKPPKTFNNETSEA
ncbi:marvel domain-containing protein [Dactylonectria estremocensis]|uniref:Marvel domain-containing protein n=1 Tax=Dactylonectria estremocensis TaxID=1079267 RepID=A0A9P9E6J4_9HYPO|nr:marvel domain-containing protein [Dactylonectria estremocensis]